MDQSEVRPYQPGDRDAVFRIAADTAFFGEPVEYYLEDRRLFCDAFYAYYTDYEPEHGWVATINRTVVGFLMGSWDTKRRDRIVLGRIIPVVAQKLILGKYRIGPLTRSYAWGLLKQAVKGFFHPNAPPLDLSIFPAHLHINLAEESRGRGLGRRLMQAYLDQLRKNRILGVHLGTTDRNAAAVRLYESMGFELLSASRDDALNYVLEQPVEDRVYVLRLNK